MFFDIRKKRKIVFSNIGSCSYSVVLVLVVIVVEDVVVVAVVVVGLSTLSVFGPLGNTRLNGIKISWKKRRLERTVNGNKTVTKNKAHSMALYLF